MIPEDGREVAKSAIGPSGANNDTGGEELIDCPLASGIYTGHHIQVFHTWGRFVE
jgi:hypothetical protein